MKKGTIAVAGLAWECPEDGDHVPRHQAKLHHKGIQHARALRSDRKLPQVHQHVQRDQEIVDEGR